MRRPRKNIFAPLKYVLSKKKKKKNKQKDMKLGASGGWSGSEQSAW